MTLSAPPLDWKQKTDAIKPSGTHFERTATAAEREALRDAYGILDVGALTIALEFRPWRKTGYRVTGTLDARTTQSCVVTLEPVEQVIHEDIDMTYLPQADAERLARRTEEEGEIVVDVESRDPPEGFSGPELDIGALAAEVLALAIDDYPRKPGVTFEGGDGAAPDEDAGEDEKRSPFAALADHALARKDGEDRS